MSWIEDNEILYFSSLALGVLFLIIFYNHFLNVSFIGYIVLIICFCIPFGFAIYHIVIEVDKKKKEAENHD